MATEADNEARHRRRNWSRALLAELTGTFVLTFAAAGADVVDSIMAGGIGPVARYLVPGLAVMALIWSLSGISGAHINPAVTLAFTLRKSFPLWRVTGYVCAQLLGATGAALTLRLLFGAAITHGTTMPLAAFTNLQAFGTEIFLTFVLVLTILGTADQKAVVGKNAALAIGGVIALCGLAFGPVSGASMNPARSIGAMIASLQFDDWWIYIIAPMLGASLAAGVAWTLYGSPTEQDRAAAGGRAS